MGIEILGGLEISKIFGGLSTSSASALDYEYASYNPAAYDHANHFCEMAANYHSETPHILDYNICPASETFMLLALIWRSVKDLYIHI
ncbi:putative choline kinase 3 [Apium graveolens]|uniref:putative choline kinase 3 n=1 Tax=Apium graveolens TaxID=4045 RepID=UPI003D78ECE9